MYLTDNEIRENVKRTLIKCRKDKKITQEQLADYLESKPTTIASWEQGKSLPNIQTLYKLAQYYGKTISYMYGDTTCPDLSPDEAELLDKYNMLNDTGKEYMNRQADYATQQADFLKDSVHAQQMA